MREKLMRHFIRLAVMGSLFLSSACARGQDLWRYDLSTDEGVSRAREAVSGKKLDEYSKGCIRRSTELPKVVVVGSFAHDYGCSFQGVFIGNRYFEEESATVVSKNALDFLGWETARQEERERLALVWVEKGLLAFLTVLEQKDEDFKDRAFQAPKATSSGNGEVTVTLWIRQPPGMSRERVYQLWEYRFSKYGDLARKKMLENLSL
jgi:hypothetical protein